MIKMSTLTDQSPQTILEPTQAKSCALCGQSLSKSVLTNDEKSFCCIGCQTVFSILSSKGELSGFKEHPLFMQAVTSGLISNPALLEEIRLGEGKATKEEMVKLHFEINDLWCPSCATIIELFLKREKGICHVAVDYSTDLAMIEFYPRHISKEKILTLIEQLGYTPTKLCDEQEKKVSLSLILRFIIAAFFSLNIMMFSYPLYAAYFTSGAEQDSLLFGWLCGFAALPVLFFSAWPIVKRCINGLLFGFVGMETLITLGISSAFTLSLYNLFHGSYHVYFDSMSVIVALVLLGKILETRAKFSAKDTLLRLTRAVPKRGRKRLSQEKDVFVLLKEVKHGDLLVAYTGEKIVLDGIVEEGEGILDESVMTGEVIPVKKGVREKVLSGTILTNGHLVYRVTATLEKTVLHHIIDTTRQDIGAKGHSTPLTDQIVKGFVPSVVAVAFCTLIGVLFFQGTIQQAVLRAISVMLISCPCAIGIAAPLTESRVLQSMAKLGAIVRNRRCLSLLGKESVFVFDKTGTITEGKYRVISGIEPLAEEDRRVLKAMTSHTTHPIGNSVASTLPHDPAGLESLEEVIGNGMKAVFKGSVYRLGSKRFLRQEGVGGLETKDTGVNTTVFFSKGQHVLTAILLGDKVKGGAKDVIESLLPAKPLLLSGDSEDVVATVARACGFKEWQSACTPLQKRECINQIRKTGGLVCMMGDGINDAPALAGADVGISVVTATDLSIQVSDIMLTTDRLSVLPQIRALAKKGRKILMQNLFWAFFYNVVGIALAVFGFLTPLYAAFAMVFSSLIVILNANRLK